MKHSWIHIHYRAQRSFLLNFARLSCDPWILSWVLLEIFQGFIFTKSNPTPFPLVCQTTLRQNQEIINSLAKTLNKTTIVCFFPYLISSALAICFSLGDYFDRCTSNLKKCTSTCMQGEGSDKKLRTLSPDSEGWLTEFILTTCSTQLIFILVLLFNSLTETVFDVSYHTFVVSSSFLLATSTPLPMRSIELY